MVLMMKGHDYDYDDGDGDDEGNDNDGDGDGFYEVLAGGDVWTGRLVKRNGRGNKYFFLLRGNKYGGGGTKVALGENNVESRRLDVNIMI